MAVEDVTMNRQPHAKVNDRMETRQPEPEHLGISNRESYPSRTIKTLSPETEKPVLPKAPKDNEKTRHILDVVVEIMQRRDGKDKTIKIIQYTGRLVLRLGKTRQLQKLFAKYPFEAAIAPLVAELSMFRKIIKFFDWFKTMRELQKADEHQLVAWVDFYTEIMDDLYLLAKIGTIRKTMAARWSRQADIGWYIAIILNLWEKYNLEPESKNTLAWRLDVSKLLCDFAFCSIDVFELEVDGAWQTVTGLGSAAIGYYKIYRKIR